LGFGVWGLEFGVWSFGFWVLGFGFRVWGLGFGVWSFGFTVQSKDLKEINGRVSTMTTRSSAARERDLGNQ